MLLLHGYRLSGFYVKAVQAYLKLLSAWPSCPNSIDRIHKSFCIHLNQSHLQQLKVARTISLPKCMVSIQKRIENVWSQVNPSVNVFWSGTVLANTIVKHTPSNSEVVIKNIAILLLSLVAFGTNSLTVSGDNLLWCFSLIWNHHNCYPVPFNT